METSAKATSFPKWAKLERDRRNYPVWRKHILDVLEASGCEQAITENCELTENVFAGCRGQRGRLRPLAVYPVWLEIWISKLY